jgi:hypothetical protein
VVGRAGARVQRGGGVGVPGEGVGVTRIRGDPLDPFLFRAAAAAGDEADLLTVAGEQPRGGRADRAGADDHVKGHGGNTFFS